MAREASLGDTWDYDAQFHSYQTGCARQHEVMLPEVYTQLGLYLDSPKETSLNPIWGKDSNRRGPKWLGKDVRAAEGERHLLPIRETAERHEGRVVLSIPCCSAGWLPVRRARSCRSLMAPTGDAKGRLAA